MGLLKFLTFRKKEKSVLASKKYNLFAKKSISLEDRRIDTDVSDREKCLLAGKYPKIFTEAEEKGVLHD